jgi:hypothetical protein
VSPLPAAEMACAGCAKAGQESRIRVVSVTPGAGKT